MKANDRKLMDDAAARETKLFARKTSALRVQIARLTTC